MFNIDLSALEFLTFVRYDGGSVCFFLARVLDNRGYLMVDWNRYGSLVINSICLYVCFEQYGPLEMSGQHKRNQVAPLLPHPPLPSSSVLSIGKCLFIILQLIATTDQR